MELRSRVIHTADYNPETKTATVTYHTGIVEDFPNISQEQFDKFTQAPVPEHDLQELKNAMVQVEQDRKKVKEDVQEEPISPENDEIPEKGKK